MFSNNTAQGKPVSDEKKTTCLHAQTGIYQIFPPQVSVLNSFVSCLNIYDLNKL